MIFKAIAGFSHIRDIKTYKLEVLINIMGYLEVMTSKMEVLKPKIGDSNARTCDSTFQKNGKENSAINENI